MKRKLSRVFLLVVTMLSLAATAQAEYPVVEWIRQLGTTNNDYGYGVSVDSSGNAYVAGYTGGGLDGNTSAGDDDMFLTKYDTNGAKLWTQQLGTNKDDRGYGVSVDSSGNAFVTGYTERGLDGNTSAGGYDMFLTKYDTNGVNQWTRQLGTVDTQEGYGVSVDSSGNAFVTGYTGGGLDGNTSAGGYDMFLTKYNTDGDKLWTRQLGTDDSDRGRGVSVDISGNAYVAGDTSGNLDGNTSAGISDTFLTKYNTGGDKLWTRLMGIVGEDYGKGVSVDSSGNAYITGYKGNASTGTANMFLIKYDTNGIELWSRQLGAANSDVGEGVTVDSSGNAYVTGWTKGNLDGNTSAGNSDMFLTKYDTDGVKLWTCQLGTDSYDYGCSVSVDGSGNAYVSGWTKGGLDGNNAGGADMFLVKISSVPEPGSIAMLVGIALTALLYWKRQR